VGFVGCGCGRQYAAEHKGHTAEMPWVVFGMIWLNTKEYTAAASPGSRTTKKPEHRASYAPFSSRAATRLWTRPRCETGW